MKAAIHLSLIPLLAAIACGGNDGARVLTEADSQSTLELKTGETFDLLLDIGPVKGPRLATYSWQFDARPDGRVLQWVEPEGEVPDDKQLFRYQAFGPGETRIVLRKVLEPNPSAGYDDGPALFDLAVKVEGERLEQPGDYLEGLEFVGGFGDSVASGTHVSALRLRPSDLTVGQGDEKLYLTSENRLWRIDPSTLIGEVVIAPAAERSASPLPAGAEVTTAEQQPDGVLLLGVRIGGENVIGRLGASTWTELYRAASSEPLVRVRQSPNGAMWGGTDRKAWVLGGEIPEDMKVLGEKAQATFEFESNTAIRFASGTSGTQLAGKDREGRLLFWEKEPSPYWELHVSPALSVSDELFTVKGAGTAEAETDFSAFQNGGSTGAGAWDAMVAAVAVTPDGAHWTFSVSLDDVGNYVLQPRPKGLYVHRP